MQDLIDELRESAEDVPVALELPSEDDLLDVEQQLYLSLPREYREFLLQASDLVLGRLEPATACDATSHTYLPELAAQCWDQGLPRHLIPVCVAGPACYCIDPDGLVHHWQHGEFQEDTWESIWDWARSVWLADARRR